MGLLDQVIGQVIGQMAGGGRGTPSRPQPGGMGGGLGDLLGGAAGKYSPLVMALLALLANKNLGSGAGGYGSVLHDIFGKLTQGQGGPMQGGGFGGPMQDRDDGQGGEPEGEEEGYAPRGRSGWDGPSGGAGPSGGFLNDVGSMLDGPGGRGADAGASLGGGAIGQGLDGLLHRFQQNGQGDVFESWLGGGANKEVSPSSLGQALGQDTVSELSRGTGLSQDDLLAQLSRALPQVVDKLTPNGHLPPQGELGGMGGMGDLAGMLGGLFKR